ncbi:hypothetical protein [Aminobacter carboxidus]|uniref:HNH endonuclease n=1 Tax=Aminobacter carboxidus TaxID=376165 RepID=A0ABR9GXH3_9HYPH|nr:hypothetical protein [Aminobacter carboxidus]MBE1208382.1 hypothetical protein [Aminobacter carboxidus]
MIELLQSELAEIAAVRIAVSESNFNSWFDKSGIKARFKKACMQQQRLRCCYCRKFKDTTNNNEWDLEHVLCEQWYPQFFATPGNLAVACKQCNIAKNQADVLLPQPRPDPRLEELPIESHRYSIPHPWIDDWDAFLSHVNYQVYRSDSEKGLALIKLCKLNKIAVEEGGLNYDTVAAAVKTEFFELVDNAIDPPPLDAEVLERVARLTDNLQELQVDARLRALGRTLATLARGAAKRTAEQAVIEAGRIACNEGLAEVSASVTNLVQAQPEPIDAYPLAAPPAQGASILPEPSS